MKRIEPKLDFSLKDNTYDNVVLGIWSNILLYGSNLINLIRSTATHENQDLYQSHKDILNLIYQARLTVSLDRLQCGKILWSPESQVQYYRQIMYFTRLVYNTSDDFISFQNDKRY